MTRLPRIIASDLDGTLARPDGSVSPRAAKAFAAAGAAGSGVLLVPGRPVRWLSRVYAHLAEPYPAVCANGAVIYDPLDDEILTETLLPIPELRPACERIRAAISGVGFATEIDGSRQMLYEDVYPLRSETGDPRLRVATLDELVETPAVKLLVRVDGWDPDELTLAVREAVGPGIFEVTHSSPHGLVELSADGVDKGSGLAAFSESVGVGPEDVLVFGDMPNDLPMFAWAAGGAVAVANAHPLVLAAATAVTSSLLDDGVAAYLESLLDED